EHAGGRPELQESNVFPLGDRAGELRLDLDDVGIGEPADQVDIVDREVNHHADIRHARRKRADTRNGDRQNILAADGFLDRLDRGIESLDVTDHQGNAGPMRRVDDLTALFHRRGNRLLHHHVDAARDAAQRDFLVEMGRCGNGDGVDVARQQFVDVSDGVASKRAGDEIDLLAIGVGNANQFGSGQAGEDPRMVASHDADSDDTHTQRTLRICDSSLHHLTTVSPSPRTFASPVSVPQSPSTASYDWRIARANAFEHVLIQSVTGPQVGPVAAHGRTAYSAARAAGTANRRPAATASSRNDFTAPRESSAADFVPSAGSFFSTSAGAVMMWQPIASASTTLKTSRVEAQMISTLRVLRARAMASRMIGR